MTTTWTIMQNFKQYLNESVIFASWQDPNISVEDARKLTKANIKKNKNGTFTCVSDNLWVTPIELDNGQVVNPINFSNVRSIKFGQDWPQLTTLEGFPTSIKDSLILNSTNLESLESLSYKLRFISLNCQKLKTFGTSKIECDQVFFYDIGSIPLKEIEKHFVINYNFRIPEKHFYRKPVLSLLKIKGFWDTFDVMYNDANDTKNEDEIIQVQDILNKHLKSGRNIIACQKELYDNDLDEYAQL